MTVFTLAFGGPDAAWMYACSCCGVQCRGTGWVAGQPMLKRLSSCKMQRVRMASSVEVHCSRCRRQMGWQDVLCGCTRVGACWHLRYMTGLEKYSRPILRDQVQDQDRQCQDQDRQKNGLETKTAVSRTTSLVPSTATRSFRDHIHNQYLWGSRVEACLPDMFFYCFFALLSFHVLIHYTLLYLCKWIMTKRNIWLVESSHHISN